MIERRFKSGPVGKNHLKTLKRPEGADTRGIEFHSVAGREHHGAGDSLDLSEAAQHVAHLGFTDGKTLPHVDMSHSVIKTGAEDVHACAESFSITGRRISASAKAAAVAIASRLPESRPFFEPKMITA